MPTVPLPVIRWMQDAHAIPSQQIKFILLQVN
jgi:hypothetical protein